MIINALFCDARRAFAKLVAVSILSGSIFAESTASSLSVTAKTCGTSIHENRTLSVDGRRRTYIVDEPAEPGPLPVIFAFHGRGESPEEIAAYSNLSASAHAVLVYPRGLPGDGGKLSWSGTRGAAPGVDDIHFTLAILDSLEARGCVDPARVYATGKSDGGGLAAQLACRAADRFAAVAPVAGAYYPIAGGCTPTRPVAILEFHGTADRVVPYDGIASRGLPPIDRWLAEWAQRDGCASDPGSERIRGRSTSRRWTGCRDGSSVEAFRLAGGGHTWPGSTQLSGPGRVSRVEATTRILSFFQNHVRYR